MRLVEGIVEVDVDEGLQLEPADRQIVAPGLETVAHADAPDRPVIDRIDGSELREIDRLELGRGLEAIELEDRRRIDRCPIPRKNS